MAAGRAVPRPAVDPAGGAGPAQPGDGQRSAVRLRPPQLGEHTDEILAGGLRLAGGAIDALRRKAVIR